MQKIALVTDSTCGLPEEYEKMYDVHILRLKVIYKDKEYIDGIDISSERSDQLTFIPFLDKLEKNLNKKYKSITADAGYESEENYTYLENNNQKAFIKPQIYEKSKTKKFKNDISKRENMKYNEEDDY